MPTAAKQATKSSAKSAPRKAASKKSASGDDAIALLTQDHREVTKLFKAYEKLAQGDADSTERLEMATQICDMLTAHAAIEEEIFYPAMREALEADDLLDEAEVEHASAKDLIAQIQSMNPDDDLFDAKVTVLGEYVQHHVKEEEGEMFAMASKAKELDLEALGVELAARKAELMGEETEEEEEEA